MPKNTNNITKAETKNNIKPLSMSGLIFSKIDVKPVK